MRRINYLLIVVALLCLGSSCTNKKKTRDERIEEFRSMLTASDTTQMLQICDNAMELLKSKKIDEVIASLHEYNDSTQEIKPLSKIMERKVKNQFRMFPVLDYKRTYYSFMLEGCNDVKYEVTFAKAEQAGTDKDPVTSFMFNPVKINGEWKLCLKALDDPIDTSMN